MVGTLTGGTLSRTIVLLELPARVCNKLSLTDDRKQSPGLRLNRFAMHRPLFILNHDGKRYLREGRICPGWLISYGTRPDTRQLVPRSLTRRNHELNATADHQQEAGAQDQTRARDDRFQSQPPLSRYISQHSIHLHSVAMRSVDPFKAFAILCWVAGACIVAVLLLRYLTADQTSNHPARDRTSAVTHP